MIAPEELAAEFEETVAQLERLDEDTRAAVRFHTEAGDLPLTRMACREILSRGLPWEYCHISKVVAGIVRLAGFRRIEYGVNGAPSRVVHAGIRYVGRSWRVFPGVHGGITGTRYSTFPAAFTAALSLLDDPCTLTGDDDE